MLRFGFKRQLEGVAVGQLEKDLSNKTGMTIRFAKDAVEDGRQLIKSQKMLTIDYRDFWKSRLEKTTKRFEKLCNIPGINMKSKKIMGLVNKMDKEKKKLSLYQNHVDNKTFDPVIFGGKENFEKRSKGLITKEEWWESKNGRISSRGDATKGGNPNLRVIHRDGKFFLRITLSKSFVKGKKKIYNKIELPLYIAEKRSKKTGKLNGRKYPELMRQVLASGEAYEVEILKRNGKFLVRIIVNEQAAPLVTYPVNGYKGVDTNPDGLAICHVKSDGNPISFSWLGDGGLQDYPTEKRENLIFEIAHKFVKSCVKDGTGAILEDLKFIQDRQVNAKFRRKSHSFCYGKILNTIERLCARYGVECIKIKPPYTSIIGRLKYQERYKVSVHQAAALVIGRRGLGFEKEKIPKLLFKILTKNQKDTIFRKKDWGRWEVIRTRIVNLMKKRKAGYYQWHDNKKDVYLKLKIKR